MAAIHLTPLPLKTSCVRCHKPLSTLKQPISALNLFTTPHRTIYRGFKFHASTSRSQTQNTPNSPLKNVIENVRSVLPGGSWWNLREATSRNVDYDVTVWEALRRIWDLLDDHHWILFLAFASLIVAACAEITMPRILASSIYVAQRGETATFYRNVRLLVVLCFISGIASGLRNGCFAVANTILVKRLRETLYSSLIFQDIAFYDKEDVKGLTNRLGADCQELSHVIGKDIHLILRNILQGTGALINLIRVSWPLALLSFGICTVLAAIFLVFGRFQKMASKLTQDVAASANETAEEALSLIKTVRVFGMERQELERYNCWLESLTFINIRKSVANGLWNMSFILLYRCTQVFALLLGGVSNMSGHLSIEELTQFILYCEWLIYATWRVVNNASSLMEAIGANEKVIQLIQLAPSDEFVQKGVRLQKLIGKFQLTDVTFCYPSRPTVPILEQLNLSIEGNEVTAIVGVSGSGKTSLVNLLLGLYKPFSGQIYVDDVPLNELDITWLRGKTGCVQQEPQLFHMDVKSNISYGFQREIKQEDIEWAAKLSNAHEFILSLPSGYETLVSNNLLSGGQKQRIAIARAILRDPNILILDEATSAQDNSESEHFVKGVLHAFRHNERPNRTIIIITHRFSTTKIADKIIVMHNGQITEVGNHKELLRKDGLYSRLAKLQTDSYHD